ncbi:trypsin-like serine peptidase [Pandoraea sp. NPDC090278]|uniref:trypsin-like serine peptidase n=1 Tax=Pandoraea sp. NPDC090278 TaxID=3364391 RepID=UPI00383A9503
MSRLPQLIAACVLMLGIGPHALAQSPIANISSEAKSQVLDEARASGIKKILNRQDRLLKQEQTSLFGKKSAEAKSRLYIIVQTRENIASANQLIDGRPPTSPDKIVTGLETILKTMRPTYGICSGAPILNGQIKDPDAWKNAIDQVSSPIAAVARSVGVIFTYKNEQAVVGQPGATVFVVGKSHVMTNRHVIQEYAYIDGSGKWHMKNDKLVLRVSFPWEYSKCLSRTTPRNVRIVAIEDVGNLDDKYADFAILRTEDNALPPPAPLADTYDLGEQDRVAVIGYPAPPLMCGTASGGKLCTSLNSEQIKAVFGLPDQSVPFSVERFAPGYVIPGPMLDESQFAYDSSTWEGNSGSPVIRLSDGKVVGLHFGGDSESNDDDSSMIGIANYAIKVQRIRQALLKVNVTQ